MNDGNNQKINNTGTTIVVIVTVVIFIGLCIGAYYLYILGEEGKDDNFVTSECLSCREDNTTTEAAYYDSSQTESKYENSRYGYSVDSPIGFTSYEADNGDGITYTNSDGAIIRVYGTNNYEGVSLNTYLNEETQRLEQNNTDVSEASINEVKLDDCDGERRSWEYTSSIDGVKTVKERVICLKDDVFYVIDLEAPSDVYDQYASVFDDIIFSYKLK